MSTPAPAASVIRDIVVPSFSLWLCLARCQTSEEASRAYSVCLRRVRGHTGQLAREGGKGLRQLVLRVEHQRAPLVHRLKRQAVVARKCMRDLDPHRAFHVVVTYLGSPIG